MRPTPMKAMLTLSLAPFRFPVNSDEVRAAPPASLRNARRSADSVAMPSVVAGLRSLDSALGMNRYPAAVHQNVVHRPDHARGEPVDHQPGGFDADIGVGAGREAVAAIAGPLGRRNAKAIAVGHHRAMRSHFRLDASQQQVVG